ncbi:hypothetical protein V1512DRAFT_266396 [Lipomyces arxii]|uniref:uncharacterized protein n=1 Tax=Lipomyces arxii TaxID=56418 RepID=UPI0034CD5949
MSYNPLELKGQKIAIIGGTSGIGYGVASAFSAEGCNIFIMSPTEARVSKAVAGFKSTFPDVTTAGAILDVRSEESIFTALQAIAPVDHIVFPAVDNMFGGPLAEMDNDKVADYSQVKLCGSMLVGNALAKFDIISLVEASS